MNTFCAPTKFTRTSTINPPPLPEDAAVRDTAEQPPLFTPHQIAAASFVGSFLAGGVVMAYNYRSLGKMGQAAASVVAGFLATLAMLLLALKIPANVPLQIWPCAQMIISLLVARNLFAEIHAAHLAKGGKRPSAWLALGLMGAGLAVAAGMGLIIAMTLAS